MRTKLRIISIVCLVLGFGLVGCDKKTASSSEKSDPNTAASSEATPSAAQKAAMNVDGLILEDGIYLTKDALKPYTGQVYALHTDSNQLHWKVATQVGKPTGTKPIYTKGVSTDVAQIADEKPFKYGEDTYEDGKLKRAVRYHANRGKKLESEYLEEGVNIRTHYRSNGNKHRELRYVEGKLDGESTFYYEARERKVVKKYVDYRYVDHTIPAHKAHKTVATFKNGKLSGDVTTYVEKQKVHGCIYMDGRRKGACTGEHPKRKTGLAEIENFGQKSADKKARSKQKPSETAGLNHKKP